MLHVFLQTPEPGNEKLECGCGSDLCKGTDVHKVNLAGFGGLFYLKRSSDQGFLHGVTITVHHWIRLCSPLYRQLGVFFHLEISLLSHLRKGFRLVVHIAYSHNYSHHITVYILNV